MQTDNGCINKKTRHLAPTCAQIIEVTGVTSLFGLKEILIGMLSLLQLSSPTFWSHFACWTEKHKSTEETPLTAEEQQDPPAQPFPAWIRATGLPTATGASGHDSLNIPWFSTYFVTQIGHLLDKQLNHVKKIWEDIDLNLLDVLSAKQGKKAWPLNQTDAGMVGKRRKTSPCLPTYRGDEGKKGIFSQFEKHIPSYWEGKEPIQTPPSTSMKATALVHLKLLSIHFPHRSQCLNPNSGCWQLNATCWALNR